MAAPINVAFDLATTETKIIVMNARWSIGDYSIAVNNGSALVEGTLDQLNRGDAENWFTLDDSSGTALTAVIPSFGIVDIQNSPIEAMRITATGATDGRVMQSGQTDHG